MARVTILTPVYDGAKFLRSCIDSVLRQTFRDWEYVLIDNRSRDATPQILREYAARDSRIRFVTNASFVGIIENHNIAFSHVGAEAEFCKVVQADDVIHPDCLEKFVAFCNAHPSATLVSAKRLVGDAESADPLPRGSSFFTGTEIGRAFFFDEWPDIFGSPTTYFLRARVVRDDPQFYNPDNLFADQEACLKALRYGDFGFIHEVLSTSRRQPGSEYSKSGYLRVSHPAYLWALVNHGPAFLTEAEYAERLATHLRNYYFVLARDLMNLRRGRSYWRYHIASLRKIGLPFDPIRLLATIPRLPREKKRNAGASHGPGGSQGA